MADIAVFITVHSETLIAGPTFRSAEAAIAIAENAGFSVDRRIGFDSASDHVHAHYAQPCFDRWDKVRYEFRDQGKTRNALAEESDARWIAFLDADDLWSENWLSEGAAMLARADAAGEKVIVHPEFNWIFEGNANVLVKVGQEDPTFVPEFFYFGNYYDALCMAPRNAHVDIRYGLRDVSSGYALEDWQWNLETMQAGWIHRTAPDTVIFKRRQKLSQTIRAAQARAVIRDHTPLRIDRIAALGKDVRGGTGNNG